MRSDTGESVEVCIVGYRSGRTIAAAVSSAAVIGPGASVAVYDNYPGDESIRVARAAAHSIGVAFRAKSCQSNCGFAAACNALAEGSRADALLFLNPDAQLVNWPFDGDVPLEGIEAPMIADASGRPLRTWATAERTLADEIRARWLRRPAPRPDGVGAVSGAVMLVGRSLFGELGGFDPRFFMYYEDLDLCGRAVAAGYAVRVRPEWHALHIGGRSAAHEPARAQLRSYEAARAYHEKWGHNVGSFDVIALLDAVARCAYVPGAAAQREVIPAAWANLRRGRLDPRPR